MTHSSAEGFHFQMPVHSPVGADGVQRVSVRCLFMCALDLHGPTTSSHSIRSKPLEFDTMSILKACRDDKPLSTPLLNGGGGVLPSSIVNFADLVGVELLQ